MIQRIAANTISLDQGGATVYHPAYVEWQINESSLYDFRVFESRFLAKLQPKRRVILSGNEIPQIANGQDIIFLGGNLLQIELLEPSKHFAQKTFRSDFTCACCMKDPILERIFEYNVVHIRLGDIWDSNHKTAKSYVKLPMEYYEKVAEVSKKPFLVVSEKATPEQEEYISKVISILPHSTRISYGCPIRDFQLFRSATTLTLATSTFSWLAGWLSDSCEELFIPNVGLFDNQIRPDIDLISLLKEKCYLIKLN